MRSRLEPTLWVLLVTEGMAVRFAPELYAEERAAVREAERWAWVLSNSRRLTVESPFPGRWEMGDFSVCLVEATLRAEPGELWIGTFWTKDGFPDPEAILFGNAQLAEEWVLIAPAGEPPTHVLKTPWLIAATYGVGDAEEEAIVQLAKVVRERLSAHLPRARLSDGVVLDRGLLPSVEPG